MAPFYHMSCTDPEWSDCPGTSSLLKPNKKLLDSQHELKSDADVLVVPFSQILDLIPWSRSKFIDMVKTDCQGKDMDVIKSMGAYLEAAVYLNCEMYAGSHYIGEQSPTTFLNYLKGKGFEKTSRRHGEFINKRLSSVVKTNRISNKCVNL